MLQPNLQNYIDLFSQTNFIRWTINSAVVATASTSISLLCSILAGYSLARLRYRGAATVGWGVFVTYLVPPTLLFLPLAYVIAQLHLFNSYWSLILTYPTFLIPFCTWLLMGYFRGIPRELEEAALVDGASRLQAMTRVVVPLALPGILSAGMFAFTLSWGEFLYAISFLVDPQQYPLSVLIASQLGQYGNNWPALMAIAVAAGLPILVIFVLSYRRLREGLALGRRLRLVLGLGFFLLLLGELGLLLRGDRFRRGFLRLAGEPVRPLAQPSGLFHRVAGPPRLGVRGSPGLPGPRDELRVRPARGRRHPGRPGFWSDSRLHALEGAEAPRFLVGHQAAVGKRCAQLRRPQRGGSQGGLQPLPHDLRHPLPLVDEESGGGVGRPLHRRRVRREQGSEVADGLPGQGRDLGLPQLGARVDQGLEFIRRGVAQPVHGPHADARTPQAGDPAGEVRLPLRPELLDQGCPPGDEVGGVLPVQPGQQLVGYVVGAAQASGAPRDSRSGW